MSEHKFDGCILAAEVVGDTALQGRLGGAEADRAIERCRNRAERAIEAYQGVPLFIEGRRLLARFQKGDNAIHAAFDMRDRVSQLPPVSGSKLAIRIAVHVCPQEEGATALQSAKDEACVMASVVPDNQIMVSAEAAERVSESVRAHLNLNTTVSVAGLNARKSLHAFLPDAAPAREVAFTPTATSIAIEPSAFDTATHSQLPTFNSGAQAQLRSTLLIRHMHHSFIVSDARPVLLAGREEGNDLVIADRRASRHHARIEWRQNRFVLIDTSTNGTYMVDDAGTEVVLRRREADLPTQGNIGFGYSPQEADAEAISFTVHHR